MKYRYNGIKNIGVTILQLSQNYPVNYHILKLEFCNLFRVPICVKKGQRIKECFLGQVKNCKKVFFGEKHIFLLPLIPQGPFLISIIALFSTFVLYLKLNSEFEILCDRIKKYDDENSNPNRWSTRRVT